jgi:hypothetical protein
LLKQHKQGNTFKEENHCTKRQLLLKIIYPNATIQNEEKNENEERKFTE